MAVRVGQLHGHLDESVIRDRISDLAQHLDHLLQMRSGDSKVSIVMLPGLPAYECVDTPAAVDPHIKLSPSESPSAEVPAAGD